MPEPLQLKSVDGQLCYVLESEPMRSGEPVELLLEDGQWLAGIYEWSGQEIRWPGLRFRLGGTGPIYGGESCRTAIVALPPDAVLRRRRR
jgi:hypothetical protein